MYWTVIVWFPTSHQEVTRKKSDAPKKRGWQWGCSNVRPTDETWHVWWQAWGPGAVQLITSYSSLMVSMHAVMEQLLPENLVDVPRTQQHVRLGQACIFLSDRTCSRETLFQRMQSRSEQSPGAAQPMQLSQAAVVRPWCSDQNCTHLDAGSMSVCLSPSKQPL